VHVFVDHDSQCTGDGEYAQHDPLAALAQRWMRDARKTTVSAQLELETVTAYDLVRRDDVLSVDERRKTTSSVHAWAWDATTADDTAEPRWPPRMFGTGADASVHTAVHELDGAHRQAVQSDRRELGPPPKFHGTRDILGPLPRGALGGSPETYQTAGLRWGTATSRSTNRGTTS